MTERDERPGPGERPGQRIYCWIWTLTWSVTAVVGAAIALIGLGWVSTLGCAVLAAGLTVGWYCTEFRRCRAPQHRLSGTLVTGIVAGVAVAGWGVAVGLSCLILPVAAVATLPGLRHWLSRPSAGPRRGSSSIPGARCPATTDGRSRRSAADAARPTSPSPAPEPGPHGRVQDLTDAELCVAWRTSYITLDRLIGTAQIFHQATWVDRRQQYLDELERRHPAGFRRWLQSGARPASDPSRYLHAPPAQPSDHRPTGRTPWPPPASSSP